MNNKRQKFRLTGFDWTMIFIGIAVASFLVALCVKAGSFILAFAIGMAFIVIGTVVGYICTSQAEPEYQYTVRVLVKPDADVSTALRQLADCIDEQDYLKLMDQQGTDGKITNDVDGWSASIYKFE